MKRVVVTGMAGLSPIGLDWPSISQNLKSLTTGIQRIDDWDKYSGLNTRLAGVIDDFERPKHYSRKSTRSMGRIALMATRATELALEDASLLTDETIKDGRMGVAFGSSTGSTKAVADFAKMLLNNSTDGLNASSYIKMMAHTAPVNIAVFFGLKGRIHTTSSACTSGSQGIGYAYEAIQYGKQTMMVAGGAEELCPTEAAVFDTLYATSTKNDHPETTPSPFDEHRDGLVIGEGAGALILEEFSSAENRGAKIYAELVGFGTNADGAHITQPHFETMQIAMQLALDDAGISPEDIGYISAHGTATDRGDIAESIATHNIFGKNTPISSFKSFTGHTLGACGALEAFVAINMMNEGWAHATANLSSIDPRCAELDYIKSKHRDLDIEYVMSNNFAFGGINTSLIFKKFAS